jgi:hypothetical protein
LVVLARNVQAFVGQVANARRKAEAEQVAQREDMIGEAGKGYARFCWNCLAKRTPALLWLAPMAGPYFSAPAWKTVLER